YFFKDEYGQAVSVNGNRYRGMIQTFFWHQLNDLDLENMWFQQDEATCHTADETIALLQEKFSERVISRRGNVNWPQRSCDLTPLDFFKNPKTIDDLKSNITRVIADIRIHLCESVIENFAQRVVICNRSRGGHFADIIFHT
ncbi:hypothetical protein X777_10511, partial [Ooceraea biroi]